MSSLPQPVFMKVLPCTSLKNSRLLERPGEVRTAFEKDELYSRTDFTIGVNLADYLILPSFKAY